MPPAATKIDLLDRLMDGHLRDYVLDRRNAKPRRSWDRIAADIRADYAVDVSAEALRLTFSDQAGHEQAAS